MEDPYKIAFPVRQDRSGEREGELFHRKGIGSPAEKWRLFSAGMETFSGENEDFPARERERRTGFSEDSRMNLVFCFNLKDSRERERV